MEVAKFDQRLHESERSAAIHVGAARDFGDGELELRRRKTLQHCEGLGDRVHKVLRIVGWRCGLGHRSLSPRGGWTGKASPRSPSRRPHSAETPCRLVLATGLTALAAKTTSFTTFDNSCSDSDQVFFAGRPNASGGALAWTSGPKVYFARP